MLCVYSAWAQDVVTIAEYFSCYSNEIQNIGTAPQSLNTTHDYLIVCVLFVIFMFYVLQKLRNYCVLKNCLSVVIVQ